MFWPICFTDRLDLFYGSAGFVLWISRASSFGVRRNGSGASSFGVRRHGGERDSAFPALGLAGSRKVDRAAFTYYLLVETRVMVDAAAVPTEQFWIFYLVEVHHVEVVNVVCKQC